MLPKEQNTRGFLAEAKFYEAYSRWDEDKGKYENWHEAVARVMNMHREYYSDKMTPELERMISEAESAYKLKYVLGAQRALQFGGDQLLKHQMRLYNCTSSYADRVQFFGEFFYILLCGAGAGFSVQKHHVAKLPTIHHRKGQAKIHTITDDIEGWATSLDVLLSSYFSEGAKYPEYVGRRVYFDTSAIREKGAFISGGFKAPGPEPLRRALDKIEHMLQGLVLAGETVLRPIHIYDICMHAADAVLAGGVRRSATICLFSPDDYEMINAKTGDWFSTNPQRARSNNSAVIVRDELDREQFRKIMARVKEFGEPGFYFVESKEFTTNPCVEIGMYPQLDGVSGWQGCNLTEINGSAAETNEDFYNSCRAASILGTLQAGYTDFKFVDETTKKIYEREALLGVSVTGWMGNPRILLNEATMKYGARIVKDVNKEVAAMIGINPAARVTCVKPSGNASTLLQTPSGIHAEHSPRFIRYAEMNKESEVAKLILESNPYMVEESAWSTNNTDYKIGFPVIASPEALFKSENYGTDFLKRVRLVQQCWIEEGTDVELCVDPSLRHSVSNTVDVKEDQWDEVEDYVYNNRHSFTGISFLASSGDKDYFQAPFTEVLTEEQTVNKYGVAALFASGLIVDTSKGFRNLWDATYIAQHNGQTIGEEKDQQADWVRRFKNFAKNYFDGDQKRAEYCLKDVYMLHKWHKIQQNLAPVSFENSLSRKEYTDINTLGAQACSGGACEIDF